MSYPADVSFDNTEIAFRSKDDSSLNRAYYLFRLIGSPAFVKAGSFLTRVALGLHIPIGWAIRKNIFAQFCGGESIRECRSTIDHLGQYRIGTILDYSVEGKEKEEDLDATCEEILRTIGEAKDNPNIPFSVFKLTGIARFALLEKHSAGGALSADEKNEWRRVQNRVTRICQLASDTGTPVFIDAEDSWIQPSIDELAESMMHRFNREMVIVYHTVQLYRHDRLAYLIALNDRARSEGFMIGLKLVRGAYMEKERQRAQEMGYRDPIQPDKAACDDDFARALKYCVDNIDRISLCCGTHNEESCLELLRLMREKGIRTDDPRVYFAQLYGMSDHISFNLSNAGYNVAKYVPYGPIREVIPYLIRRAQENTSVKGQTGRELSLILKEMGRRRVAGSR